MSNSTLTLCLAARRALTVAAAALALAGAASNAPARAADSPAAFGSVDIQKIESGYNKKADYDRQITTLEQQLNADMTELGNSPMLDKADQDQLGALLAKPAPTPQDTAQIAALEAKSKQATQQLAALQQKQTLTAQDSQTMSDLIAMQKLPQPDPDVQAAYSQQVQQLTDKLSAQMSDEVKTAIATVAKQRGLAVVFDSQVAIYTANDITDAVVKVLNK